MAVKPNRRDFLKTSAAAGVGFWIAGRQSWADELASKSPNERINVASIGVGGKGSSDCDHCASHANIVAICDVDEKRLDEKAKKLPTATKFTDYRQMFDKMAKDFDAIHVSIPDHSHAAAAMLGIKAGKHVYCQKPMTHTVFEARSLRLAAREHKVCTQLGNQGTSLVDLRRGVETMRAGVLGAITEVHVWTNRPIWPQAPFVMERPAESPVPPDLHWDEWLGPAPKRPYGQFKYTKKVKGKGKDKDTVKDEVVTGSYAPFNWRGWWDFGCGALGDMGCHTANMPFMGLKLMYPTSVIAECGDLNVETYPSWATIKYEFPSREGLPPVKLTWWEGHKDREFTIKNQPPTELFQGQKINDSGSLIIGEKGTMYSAHDYGGNWKLLPTDTFKDFKDVEPTLPRMPQDDLAGKHHDGGDDERHKMEWLMAIKANKPEIALSNFDYSGPLTEFLLLGNIAIRESAKGTKLAWDGENMKFTNSEDANKWLKYEYRDGWTL